MAATREERLKRFGANHEAAQAAAAADKAEAAAAAQAWWCPKP